MKRIIVFMSVLSALLSSCAETIIMDPQEEMPVVVNCVLTRDINKYMYPEEWTHSKDDPPTQYLDLYHSRRPSESGYEVISEADVTVSGNNQEYKFEWNGARWECDFLPEYDTAYTLRIAMPDGETLEAETQFPGMLVVQGVGGLFLDFDHESIIGLAKNYDYCAYYLAGFESNQGNPVYYPYDEDAFLWIVADDVACFSTDHPGVDQFNVMTGRWSELDYVQYYRNLVLAPQLRESNLRWWNEYSSYCAELPLYKNTVRIYHSAEQHSSVPFDLVPEDGYSDRLFILSPEKSVEYIEIHNLSKEYDKYQRTLVDEKMARKDELTTVFSMRNIFSNVSGGKGIFGAQTTQRLYLKKPTEYE